MIGERKFDSILEIGCGSGNYTLLLNERFTVAGLKAIDISQAMIDIASYKLKNCVEFVVEDAETIDLNENFGLITSNACLQWLDDLEKALLKYKTLLDEKGVISFSIFGPDTFYELNQSLRKLTGYSAAAVNFMPGETIEDILNRHFKHVSVQEMRHVEFFDKLKDLFDKIKYTGIRGEGLGKRFFGVDLFNKLEENYRKSFCSTDNGKKRIPATYQIFLCRAEKT